MSLRNSRLIAVVALCLLVAGCGFSPMYSKEASADAGSQIFGGVRVEPIHGRSGQIYRGHLEDLLNQGGVVPPSPAYRLEATLASSTIPIDIARDGTVSRYNIYIDSHYTLFRTSDGQAVTSGNLRHVSSYNNLSNAYFSTFMSEADVTKRGIRELAEDCRQRIASYLSKPDAGQKAITPEPATTPMQVPDPKDFIYPRSNY